MHGTLSSWNVCGFLSWHCVGWFDSWSICHNFPKWPEVTVPRSYLSTYFINDFFCILSISENLVLWWLQLMDQWRTNLGSTKMTPFLKLNIDILRWEFIKEKSKILKLALLLGHSVVEILVSYFVSAFSFFLFLNLNFFLVVSVFSFFLNLSFINSHLWNLYTLAFYCLITHLFTRSSYTEP